MADLSSIMRGADLDAKECAIEGAFDSRRRCHNVSRAPGKESLSVRPLRWRVAQHLPRRPIHDIGYAVPAVLPPRRTQVVPVVTRGFGRYIPYTATAAVASGAWDFVPTFGGLRVAMSTTATRGMIQAGGDPSGAALAIARDPAKFGYVLHNDTYVPATLSPGDRQLLSASA